MLVKIIANKLAVTSTTETLLKKQFFADIFEIEGYEYAVLRNCSSHIAL